jgi:hypothetical protein
VEEGRAYNELERNTGRVQHSPCQRVVWRAADNRVEADLILERCWAATPLDEKYRSTLNAFLKISVDIMTNSTYLLWAIRPLMTFHKKDCGY